MVIYMHKYSHEFRKFIQPAMPISKNATLNWGNTNHRILTPQVLNNVHLSSSIGPFDVSQECPMKVEMDLVDSFHYIDFSMMVIPCRNLLVQLQVMRQVNQKEDCRLWWYSAGSPISDWSDSKESIPHIHPHAPIGRTWETAVSKCGLEVVLWLESTSKSWLQLNHFTANQCFPIHWLSSQSRNCQLMNGC